VNFCAPDEAAALESLGFERRVGYQFQWINRDWRTFDDYLAALRSKRRNQVNRERRALAAQGIAITHHLGAAIDDDDFDPMFRLYRTTVDKFVWGHRYLNRALFRLLRDRWKHRLCFILARRGDTLVAGTFNVVKGDVFYGRYWGAFEDVPFLHFNVCYYAAIELCLQVGLARLEPGAGGAFKHLRGFDARATESMHFVTDARLAAAVRRYLHEERRAVAGEIRWMDEQSALKR
jgi:predicted N-acyltransferase